MQAASLAEPLLPDLSAEFAGLIGGTPAERLAWLTTLRDRVRGYIADMAAFHAAMVAERQRVLELTAAKLAELSAAQEAASTTMDGLDEFIAVCRSRLILELCPPDRGAPN